MNKVLFVALVSALTHLAVLSFSSAHAQNATLRDDIPDSYTVVKGDTLWDISGIFLKNPWYWPEIWHVNTQIANPHLIYPGDVLRLVYIDGQPRIVLDNSGRIQKLSPQIREIQQSEAIQTISLDQINSFLSRSRVVGESELEMSPHVVIGQDKHLLVGAGDKVYVRGNDIEEYGVYGVFRRGQVYLDPLTGEKLGVQAINIGSGKVYSQSKDVSTFSLTRTTEEVRIGDRLLRQEERAIDSTFFPSAPEHEVDGLIIAVEEGVNQVGNRSVVVINRGERENMKAGNVLAIYKRSGEVRDAVRGDTVQLPDERAGLMMIFRTFEKVSFGLVLKASRGLSVNDVVKNP